MLTYRDMGHNILITGSISEDILKQTIAIVNRFRMLCWFLGRPLYWKHALAMISRKFLGNYDSAEQHAKAIEWAASNAISHSEALLKLGVKSPATGLDESVISEANIRAAHVSIKMGGPGDVDLLFDLVRLLRPSRVIETGVACGWSSLAILHAMSLNGCGRLVSVDMPYPNRGTESFVGVVVPERYRKRWTLIRKPDRPGLREAIRVFQGCVDLCHYDSDKNWWGRAYSYPLMWDALKSGGIFVSDDIQDNLFFARFVEAKKIPFVVTQCNGKFVGILRKP